MTTAKHDPTITTINHTGMATTSRPDYAVGPVPATSRGSARPDTSPPPRIWLSQALSPSPGPEEVRGVAQTVHIHLGLPKTGTSFVQSVVRENRDELMHAGLLAPFRRFDSAYAVHQLAAHGFDGTDAAWTARWDHFSRQTRRWKGDVLLSHEAMSGLKPAGAHALAAHVSALGADVSVVVTVRDLARQIPSVWQQEVKSGRATTFAAYLYDLRRHRSRSRFWREQDAARIVEQWCDEIGPDRVTVVTVPAPASEPGLLWKRFATAVGVDPETADPARGVRSNVTFGVVEVELIRRTNAASIARAKDSADPDLIQPLRIHRARLASRMTSRGDRTMAPTYGEQHHPWVTEESVRTAEAIAATGCRVEGDLAELAAGPTPPPGRDPGSVTDQELAELAPDILNALLSDHERLMQRSESWLGLRLRGSLDRPDGPKTSHQRKRPFPRRVADAVAGSIKPSTRW